MVAAVKADATLAAAVGTRVYPDVAPQGAARPHLVWQQTGGGPKQSSGGPGPDAEVTVRWTIRADTRLSARTVAGLIADVLDGWTSASTEPAISGCTLEDESGDWDYLGDDSETVVRIVEQEYSIWFVE